MSTLLATTVDGEAEPGPLVATMRRSEGTVLQTSLDEEPEAALRQALP